MAQNLKHNPSLTFFFPCEQNNAAECSWTHLKGPLCGLSQSCTTQRGWPETALLLVSNVLQMFVTAALFPAALDLNCLDILFPIPQHSAHIKTERAEHHENSQ